MAFVRRLQQGILDVLVKPNKLRRSPVSSSLDDASKRRLDLPFVFSSVLDSPLSHASVPISSAVVDARCVPFSLLSTFLYRTSSLLARQSTRDSRLLYVASSASPLQISIMEGAVRSLSKELGPRGSTVNLVVSPPGLDPPRFFTGDGCAYLSGQSVRVASPPSPPPTPLCVVTGGARGIGLSVADRLSDKYRVMVVDHPSSDFGEAEARGFEVIKVDVTSPDAAEIIADKAGGETIGGLVHAAGITRDKTMKRVKMEAWRSVMDVNLHSVMSIDAGLSSLGALERGCRVVAVGSTSGVAGNVGQTNYAASKSGLAGWAEEFTSTTNGGREDVMYNVVAPGFIETDMTKNLPTMVTFMATRVMCPLRAAGLPSDVSKAVEFLMEGGCRGQTLRVCGGMLIGR